MPSAISNHGQTGVCLQGLFLLDIATLSLTYFRARRKASLITASWSASSRLILVAWECDKTLYVFSWEVLDRQGRRVAKFTDPGKSPVLAQLPGERVAIAHYGVIHIWCLRSGCMRGHIFLPPPAQAPQIGDMLGERVKLALNKGRSKLAYCLNLQVIHLFDLQSLDLLGSFALPQGLSEPHMVCESLAWGVFGFSLLVSPCITEEYARTYYTHLMRPEPDVAAFKQVHWRSDTPRQLPVMSACGTFACVCSLQEDLVNVKVYDVRNGQLVQQAELVHGITDSMMDTPHVTPGLSITKVWWSACGVYIVVHLAQLQHMWVVSQHVLCVQFSPSSEPRT